jgi:hypothetical protein
MAARKAQDYSSLEAVDGAVAPRGRQSYPSIVQMRHGTSFLIWLIKIAFWPCAVVARITMGTVIARDCPGAQRRKGPCAASVDDAQAGALRGSVVACMR